MRRVARTGRPARGFARRLGGLALAAVLALPAALALLDGAARADWCAAAGPADAARARALVARAEGRLGAAPHPLPRLSTEGRLPGDPVRTGSETAAADFPALRDAALAWRLTGDRRYLAQVDRTLAAWMAVYAPSFNPIDETRLDALIEGYALARAGLAPGTRQAAEAFLRELAEGYLTRATRHSDPRRGPGSTIWVNNWQSHRVKLVALAAAALDDARLMERAERLFRSQVSANIGGDGEVVDFREHDALRYVVYDLEPLAVAAIAARPFGRDWLHLPGDGGSSLATALAWLAPYARGARTHREFAGSRVPFDRERAAAGVPGFAGTWQPANAGQLYWLAAWLDPAWLTLAARLAPEPPDWLALCRPGWPPPRLARCGIAGAGGTSPEEGAPARPACRRPK